MPVVCWLPIDGAGEAADSLLCILSGSTLGESRSVGLLKNISSSALRPEEALMVMNTDQSAKVATTEMLLGAHRISLRLLVRVHFLS